TCSRCTASPPSSSYAATKGGDRDRTHGLRRGSLCWEPRFRLPCTSRIDAKGEAPMAHSILGQRFGQQDLRRPPWHEIQSAVLRPQTNVSEALGLIDGDFLIEKAPLYVYYAQRGIRVVDQFALVRPALTDVPEPEVLGIVGKDYELIQH